MRTFIRQVWWQSSLATGLLVAKSRSSRFERGNPRWRLIGNTAVLSMERWMPIQGRLQWSR